jgi:UDP-N-acetyl-D-glucosamine dehydrogenase
VAYHDPHVAQLTLAGQTWISEPLTPAQLGAADCVVVATDHSGLDWALVRAHARVIVDTRNALRGQPLEGPGARIVKL